jgi:hypothetical protein
MSLKTDNTVMNLSLHLDWSLSSGTWTMETISSGLRRLLCIQQYYSPIAIRRLGSCIQVL